LQCQRVVCDDEFFNFAALRTISHPSPSHAARAVAVAAAAAAGTVFDEHDGPLPDPSTSQWHLGQDAGPDSALANASAVSTKSILETETEGKDWLAVQATEAEER
jgi:hypothetical protein